MNQSEMPKTKKAHFVESIFNFKYKVLFLSYILWDFRLYNNVNKDILLYNNVNKDILLYNNVNKDILLTFFILIIVMSKSGPFWPVTFLKIAQNKHWWTNTLHISLLVFVMN